MSAALHVHEHPRAPVGGKLITPTTVILGALVLAMVGMLLVRFVKGIGATTNLNDGYPWGLWIAWDVCGSALAAGGFATAFMVFILNRGQYHPLMRPAFLAALLGYIEASVSVVADIGRWWNAWHIFWPGYMQFNSALLIVALCVVTYTTLAMVQFIPAVTERLKWAKTNSLLNKFFFLIVAIGVLVPIMHQSALGTMLIVFGNQVHPLYQTNLLPLLFLASTVGMGFAAVTLEGAITSSALKRPFEKDILASLLNIGRYLMIFFLVLRFADLVYRGVLGLAFTYSRAMVSFWFENALMSVPIWLLATKQARNNSQYVFLSAMAMAIGGILYRVAGYLIAYDTGGNWHYFPSIGEWVITIGLIAAEVLCIIVAVRLLPILPAEPGSRTSS